MSKKPLAGGVEALRLGDRDELGESIQDRALRNTACQVSIIVK